MILLDTGFFIALFSSADELHDRAIAWSFHLRERMIVTEYVLWECVNTFSRPKDRPTAHRLIEYVRSEPGFELVYASPELFAAGLRLHGDRPDKEWSLTDCISFHLMGQRGIECALAYDIHFEQAGFISLLRSDPPAPPKE